MKCLQCGYDNHLHQTRCANCGSKLGPPNPVKALQLNRKATDLARHGDVKDAIETMLGAIQLDPQNGIYHFDLGLLYGSNHEAGLAMEEFRLCLSLAPEYSDAYYAMAPGDLASGDDWKVAIDYLAYLEFGQGQEYAKTAEDRLRQLGKAARRFDAQHWLDVAESEYAKLIKHMTDTASHLAEQITQSHRDYRKQIVGTMTAFSTSFAEQKAVLWAQAHTKNADNFISAKQYRAAIAQLITGLEVFPHDHLARLMLSMALHLAGDDETAASVGLLVDRSKLPAELKS